MFNLILYEKEWNFIEANSRQIEIMLKSVRYEICWCGGVRQNQIFAGSCWKLQTKSNLYTEKILPTRSNSEVLWLKRPH